MPGFSFEKMHLETSPLENVSCTSVTLFGYAKISDIFTSLHHNPKGVAYNDLCKVCNLYLGEARQSGSNHRVYKTPRQGDPRVNIQNDKGIAKVSQVNQMLKVIERLEAQENVAE
jgi:hypothetical protein